MSKRRANSAKSAPQQAKGPTRCSAAQVSSKRGGISFAQAAKSTPLRPSSRKAPTARRPQPQAHSARRGAPAAGSSSRFAQARPDEAQGRRRPQARGRSSRSETRREPAREKRDFSGFPAPIAFFCRHIRIMGPFALVVLAVLVAVLLDFGIAFGKVHPGVKVQGVDVGGLSQGEAAQRIEEALKPQLSTVQISLYRDEAVAAADGAQLASAQGASDEHAAAADEYDDDLAAEQSSAGTTGVDLDGDGKDDRWTISASTVGAAVDSESLAAKAYAVGRGLSLFSGRWNALFGKVDIPASITCNQDLLSTLSTELNAAVGTAMVDYQIQIENGAAQLSEGHEGLVVDEDALTQNMAPAFFDSSAPATTIPMQASPIHITQATAQKVLDQVDTALSQPFTISYADKSWTLDAAAIGALVGQQILAPGDVLVFSDNTQKVARSSDGAQASYDASTGADESGYTLQAYIDQDKADAYIVGLLGDAAEGDVRDASFDTSGGEVTIVESHVGTGPDHHAAALAMQDDLFGTAAEHSVQIEEVVIQPKITTEDAQGMGIKERLASWSIPLSGTEARMHNIDVLCQLIDGSLVKPGDTWSFNATTGERTEEKGFQKAPVIVDGAHEDQLGGGVCQVATCVFNTACYAGLGIENRVNHSFYIPAYDDEGFADATVSWPEPDFAFVNDMDNWVLLTANTDDGSVNVALWGTSDGRSVTCERGEWQEGEKYQQIRQEDPTLAAGVTELTQSGVDGRKIKIRYTATSATGEVLHDIEFNSEYVPQNEITKVGTNTDANAPTSVAEAKARSSG